MARPLFQRYRLWPHVDWLLLALVVALAAFGVVTLWGATNTGESLGPPGYYVKAQVRWVVLGLIGVAALVLYDYRGLKPLVWVLYAVLVLALIGLLIKSDAIKGASSWYRLGPASVQPSEFGKIVLVLTLARYLARRGGRFRGLRHTFVPGLLAGVPVVLILLQPDFGTAFVYVPMIAAMFWVAGLRLWVFGLFLVAGLAAAVVGYPHLKPYQQERIKTFLDPEADPRGKGYNVIQARTALGSGGLTGKGWGQGTQTKLRFLPEYRTDFIFPTVGEQFGLVGCVVVLLVHLLVILRMMRLAGVTQDMFGVLIISGLTVMLATHVVMNVGMAVGLLPVTGLPLPFFSYGGSFMLTCMAAVGLALGIGARRYL